MLIAMTVVFLFPRRRRRGGSGRCSFLESSSFMSSFPARSARCATRSFRRADHRRAVAARPEKIRTSQEAGSVAGPMLSEAAGYPIFGEGLGTRITGFSSTFRNAPILDNQWLNTISSSVRRCGVLALALRPQRQAPLPCVTGVGGRRRLAFRRTCRFDHGLRRRDADIRRVQVHAGHVRLLDPARALRGDAADQRGDAGGGAGVGAATAAGPRGERLARPCRGRADQRDAFVGAGASRRLAQVAIEVGSDPGVGASARDRQRSPQRGGGNRPCVVRAGGAPLRVCAARSCGDRDVRVEEGPARAVRVIAQDVADHTNVVQRVRPSESPWAKEL